MGKNGNRLVITNLCIYTERITTFILNGNASDSVYTHYHRAFDLINIKLLIYKSRDKGIVGNCLSWLDSDLIGRTQQEKINKFISKKFNVISGVAQGSHLGPL